MDELLKNLRNYVGILDSCRTDEVSKWRMSDLERAIKWSKHFENVAQKLSKAKPHLLQQFTEKLKAYSIDSSLQKFSHDKSSWIEFLKHSHKYLIKSLLGNPSLSEELRQHLIPADKAESCSTNEKIEEKIEPSLKLNNESSGDHHLSQPQPDNEDNKLLEVLLDVTSTISSMDIPSVKSAVCDVLISSVAIMEEFKQIVKSRSSQHAIRENLCTIANEESGLEAILVCLSHTSRTWREKKSSYVLLTGIQQEILQWISSSSDEIRDKIIISVPPQTLAYISERSHQFFHFYLTYLATSTDLNALIVQQSMKGTIENDTLLKCWQCLAYTDQSIKEKCVEIIKEKVDSTTSNIWNKIMTIFSH